MNEEKVSDQVLSEKIYVGIDVHAKSYAVTVVCEGRATKKWSMPAENENLVAKLQRDYGNCTIYTVYEAGFSGFVLHRALEKAGINNVVVHAAGIAISSGDRVKTDRRDSEKLATLLSKGMLKGVRIPSLEEELKRQLNRLRQQLMKERTRFMLQIRRRLYHFGYGLDLDGVLQRRQVRELLDGLPASELKLCVESQLRLWEALERELREINKLLSQQAAQCPYEEMYRSLPGIGRVSARILANELGDMQQFRNEKALFCFVGLTPTEHSSGEHIRRGHISRQGNGTLRKILVEAAWVAIRNDVGLKRYYSRLAARAGGKRAIVAVARKLIGRARAVFRTGEFYRVTEESQQLAVSLAA
jgi:transposase